MSSTVCRWAVPSTPARPASQPAHASAAIGAYLSREAVRLLLALDATRTVRALPSQYPHVLNRLASVWSVPAAAQRCLEDLLLTSRSDRQGFPPAVIAELALLQARNSKRLPSANQDIWSQTMLR